MAKAQLIMGLKPITGLIMAIIVIIATIGFFYGLSGIFGGGPDEETSSAFSRFMESVEIVAKADEPCYFTGSWDIDFAIVGFDKNEKEVIQECDRAAPVFKPKSCVGACICLCDGGTGDVSGDDCKPEDCKPMTEFEEFKYPSHGDDGATLGNLIIYNKACGGTVWREGTNSYLLEKDEKTFQSCPAENPEQV